LLNRNTDEVGLFYNAPKPTRGWHAGFSRGSYVANPLTPNRPLLPHGYNHKASCARLG